MGIQRDRDRRRRLHRLTRRRRAARRRLRGDRDRRPLLGRRRQGRPRRRAARAGHRRSACAAGRRHAGAASRDLPPRGAGERGRLRRRTPAATAKSTSRHAQRGRGRAAHAGRRSCSRRPAGRCTATMRRCRPNEQRIPAPLSPYGASKWAAEAYVKTWSLSSDIPHAVCRLGNVYGPRQSPHGEAGVVAIFATTCTPDRRPSCSAMARRRATTCTSATSSARC